MTAYFILYENLPVMLTPFNLPFALLASGLALACTVLATVFPVTGASVVTGCADAACSSKAGETGAAGIRDSAVEAAYVYPEGHGAQFIPL